MSIVTIGKLAKMPFRRGVQDRRVDALRELRWVLLAASKDELRPVLCCIHAEEDRVWASDGHRIHATRHGAQTYGLEAEKSYLLLRRFAGGMQLISVDRADLGNRPDKPEIDGILRKAFESPACKLSPGSNFDITASGILQAFGMRFNGRFGGFHVEYLRQIDPQQMKEIYIQADPFHATGFRSETREAVLMPLRANDEDIVTLPKAE